MPVTLLIIRGSYLGQQVLVGDGQTVTIGRTDRSNYSFPNDSYLSGRHFEVGCDGQVCTVRDLASANGTFVNGAKIQEVLVREGDQISAGEIIFLVQAARQDQPAACPPPTLAVPPPPVQRTARMYAAGFQPPEQPLPLAAEWKRALHILTHQATPLFAVLDAARATGLPHLIETSRLRCQFLFDGQTTHHAPVLLDLGLAGTGTEALAFLEGLLGSGWGKNWGVFCMSASPFEELLEHFRSFLLMSSSEQRPLYLRFYDARILRALLPLAEPHELKAIFGPVVSYLVESDRTDTMLAYSPGADGLITARVSLAEKSLEAGVEA